MILNIVVSCVLRVVGKIQHRTHNPQRLTFNENNTGHSPIPGSGWNEWGSSKLADSGGANICSSHSAILNTVMSCELRVVSKIQLTTHNAQLTTLNEVVSV